MSRKFRKAAIFVALFALLAAIVSFWAVKLQAFSPTFDITLNVHAGADPKFGMDSNIAFWYTAVDFSIRKDVFSARWFYAVSLFSLYSIVLCALVLISVTLWKLGNSKVFSSFLAFSLGGFGIWIIISTALHKIFYNLAIVELVKDLKFSTVPQTGQDSVILPSFHMTQTMVLLFSTGSVIVVAAIFIERAWRMQQELDEVI